MFVLDGLNWAGAIASSGGYPLLIIACVLAVWVFKMIRKTPTGYQIDLLAWQGKAVLGLLAIGAVLYAVDIADRFGGRSWLEAQIAPTEVYDKTFVSERVPLDHYGYHHCKFYNVTFVMNGRPGKTELDDSLIVHPTFASDNPDVDRVILTMVRLNVVKLNWMNRTGDVAAPGSGLTNTAPQ